MSASATSTATPAVPRTWRSLFTGRWHRSSWVVAALVLLLLVFCNLPGQWTVVFVSANKPGQRGHLAPQLEHGWPLTYLVREIAHDPFDAPSPAWLWKLHLGVKQFLGAALVANVALVLLTSISAGVVFEVWRRARHRLWQLHIRDLAVLVTLTCLVGGWYAAKIRGHMRERALLNELATCERPMTGGVTWLRLAFPAASFELLDPVVEISVNPTRLPKLPPLADVRAATLQEEITELELDSLRNFPNVEVLQLFGFQCDDSPLPLPDRTTSRIRLPPLMRLRTLTIYFSRIPLAGLGELKSLEELNLCYDAYFDEGMVRELSGLPKLQSLSIWNGGFIPLASLSQLKRLSITVHETDGDLMQEIGQLRGLTQLDLWAESLPASRLSPLSKLGQLEEFDLFSDSVITASDIENLVQLQNLRIVCLSKTPITPDLIPALARLTQVRSLAVPKKTFTSNDVERLKQQLPKCRVTTLATDVY